MVLALGSQRGTRGEGQQEGRGGGQMLLMGKMGREPGTCTHSHTCLLTSGDVRVSVYALQGSSHTQSYILWDSPGLTQSLSLICTQKQAPATACTHTSTPTHTPACMVPRTPSMCTHTQSTHAGVYPVTHAHIITHSLTIMHTNTLTHLGLPARATPLCPRSGQLGVERSLSPSIS